MNKKNTFKFLGIAFLIQAIASAVGGLILLNPFIIPGNITESMNMIANNGMQIRAGIVAQMITAMGIVALGALMYEILNKQNRDIARVAFGLYLVEAAILSASRIPAYGLLHISQEAVKNGYPSHLVTLGDLLYQSAEFGDWLHMFVFGLGATMFYFLFFKSRLIPRTLSTWGLIAASLAFIGTLLILFDFDVPLIVFLPNLPFELTIGVWLIIKGFNKTKFNSLPAEKVLKLFSKPRQINNTP